MNICLVQHKYNVPLEDPCCYPLGFMYVSASLKEKGHNVKVLNYNLWNYDLKKELDGQEYAMFTGFEEFLPYIKRDSVICKELGVKTVVGGALATFRPKMMSRICDNVVQGEAPRNQYPDYEGFGIEEYHKRHKIRYMGVLTSYGCKYNCSFCANVCKLKLRKIDDVFAEIDLYVHKYGIEYVVFNDNTFNLSKGRVLDICRGMKKRGLKWSAAFRLDVIDDQMCKAIRKSFCNGIIVGVESFNQSILDKMNKKIKVDQITNGLDLLHKHKIPYYGNVLFGFDGQSAEDIEEELKRVPDKYNLFPALVRPFVGTSEGTKSLLTEEERKMLDDRFREIIYKKGMYCYPELETTL